MTHFEFGTISGEQDEKRLGEILCQSFNFPVSEWPVYRDQIGVENFRVLRDQGKLAAGLAILPMGQWFGDQCVSMAGIAAVGVLPEYRGMGTAGVLMSQTVKELFDRGFPLSVLYPATQRLYRKVGYEQAGSRCGWEIPLQSIQVSAKKMPVYCVATKFNSTFETLYRQKATLNFGNVERHPALWQAIFDQSEHRVYTYLFGSEDQPEGYLVFNTEREGHRVDLRIRDGVFLTPGAGLQMWSFIASHRSQIERVKWYGSPLEPWLLMLPEQTAKLFDWERWFLRIVNVKLALEKRRYPANLKAELHLAVQDDLLAENNGNFVVKVANGKAEVTPGGMGELKLDIRGLSPLYTSFLSAEQLKGAGLLDATDQALAIATQMFAGPSPWMVDFF